MKFGQDLYSKHYFYIVDMRTKEVSKCTLKTERSAFSESRNYQWLSNLQLIPLVSVVLGFKCRWWHPRQANDAVASQPSSFSENHNYKRFFRVAVNTYISGSRCMWWQKTMNRHTHIHTGQLQ